MDVKVKVAIITGVLGLIAALITTLGGPLLQNYLDASNQNQGDTVYEERTDSLNDISSQREEEQSYMNPSTANTPDLPAIPKTQSRVIREEGVGFARSDLADHLKLSAAERAARLDAMRRLAESVRAYVHSTSKLSMGELTEDQVLVIVETHLDGAREVSKEPLSNGGYKVVMEVILDQN